MLDRISRRVRVAAMWCETAAARANDTASVRKATRLKASASCPTPVALPRMALLVLAVLLAQLPMGHCVRRHTGCLTGRRRGCCCL